MQYYGTAGWTLATPSYGRKTPIDFGIERLVGEKVWKLKHVQRIEAWRETHPSPWEGVFVGWNDYPYPDAAEIKLNL